MFCRLSFGAAFLAPLLALLPAAHAQSPNSSLAAAADHDTATLDRYVGQYRHAEEPEIVISVFRDGDHLAIESARSPRQELIAEPADSFVVKETPQHLVF